MVDAFATAADLALRLNRTFAAGAETAWITSLLEDASTYLRDDVIGLQVFPQASTTYTVYPDGGRVDLPQSPVISIDTVERASADVPYTRRDETIWVEGDDALDVTFTYGYEIPPASLVRWTCVLVSQVLIPLEQNLGLTVGGLSSVAVDDFKAAFADAGDNTGITLTERNIALIRSQFGTRNAAVVTTR